MELWLWSVLGGLLVLATLLLVWQKEPVRRARLVRRAGFTILAVFSVLGGAFIAGETFDDPGGWAAAGLVAAWLVPLALFAVAAWLRPGRTAPVLGVLTAAVVGLSVWAAAAPEAWRAFENRDGPIRAVTVFALAAVLAVLGLRRTAAAGVMLVVIGVVPAAVASLQPVGGVSLGVVSAPAVIGGVLYLVSAAAGGRGAGPRARGDESASEHRHPRAA